MSTPTVVLYDTTLRDGTQGENITLSLADKLRVARMLDEYGLPYVEGDYTLEESLSWTPIVDALAAQAPIWEPGTKHGYHMRTFGWLVSQRPCRGTIVPNFYSVGVRSVPVVAITGTFIGMVLAVQSYGQFYQWGLATRLGSIINLSIVDGRPAVLDLKETLRLFVEHRRDVVSRRTRTTLP